MVAVRVVICLAIILLAGSANAADLAWGPSPVNQACCDAGDCTGCDGCCAPTGYKIYYGNQSGTYQNQIYVELNTQWHIPDVWPNGIYYFAATGYNAAGESGFSNEAIFTKDIQQTVQPASGGAWQLAFVEDQPMAISFTQLTEGYSTNNPATTASISPTANRQVFVAVGTSLNGAETVESDTLSVSGCNLTWTQVGANKTWGFRRGIYVWRGVGASPSSGVLTITYTPTNGYYEQMKWSVDEAASVDATTPTGAPFYNESIDENATSLSVTISETPGTDDIVYAVFGIENNTTPSLNSELDNTLTNFGDSTGTRRFVVAYDSAPDSTPVPGLTWSTPSYTGGIAFIINAAAGGSQSIIPILMHSYRLRRN
jgi:hypothetical protein